MGRELRGMLDRPRRRPKDAVEHQSRLAPSGSRAARVGRSPGEVTVSLGCAIAITDLRRPRPRGLSRACRRYAHRERPEKSREPARPSRRAVGLAKRGETIRCALLGLTRVYPPRRPQVVPAPQSGHGASGDGLRALSCSLLQSLGPVRCGSGPKALLDSRRGLIGFTLS
jgi:hypothetical protein